MTSYVSVKVSPTEYKSFEVPEEVATYIKQLECYIKCPEKSKLKELYHERFDKDIELVRFKNGSVIKDLGVDCDCKKLKSFGGMKPIIYE